MSKLIVDMPMPKTCGECPLLVMGVCIPEAKIISCKTTEKSDKCPIKGELPDKHGDLIDRQKAIFEICDGLVPKTYRHYAKKILESEILLPTIISAERKDDGTTVD